jgi:hypothetical protein
MCSMTHLASLADVWRLHSLKPPKVSTSTETFTNCARNHDDTYPPIGESRSDCVTHLDYRPLSFISKIPVVGSSKLRPSARGRLLNCIDKRQNQRRRRAPICDDKNWSFWSLNFSSCVGVRTS